MPEEEAAAEFVPLVTEAAMREQEALTDQWIAMVEREAGQTLVLAKMGNTTA